MGAGNALLVVTRWSPYLPDTAFRVLVAMALISLDADDVLRYWGGWPTLATAIGAPFPDSCAKGKHAPAKGKAKWGVCGDCDAAQRAVSRAVANLIKVGAITQTGRPMKGRNAEYALLIRDQPAGEKRARQMPKPAPQKTSSVGCAPVIERQVYTRRAASPAPDVERRAEEEGGGVTGIDQESRSPLPGTSPGADGDLGATPNPIPQPRNEPDLTQCPYCRWRAWEGHAAGCSSGR